MSVVWHNSKPRGHFLSLIKTRSSETKVWASEAVATRADIFNTTMPNSNFKHLKIDFKNTQEDPHESAQRISSAK